MCFWYWGSNFTVSQRFTILSFNVYVHWKCENNICLQKSNGKKNWTMNYRNLSWSITAHRITTTRAMNGKKMQTVYLTTTKISNRPFQPMFTILFMRRFFHFQFKIISSFNLSDKKWHFPSNLFVYSNDPKRTLCRFCSPCKWYLDFMMHFRRAFICHPSHSSEHQSIQSNRHHSIQNERVRGERDQSRI